MQVPNNEKKKIFYKTLGQTLKKLRKDSNLSARAVAYSIEISKTTILQAENGTLDPQLTNILQISRSI